MNMVGTFCTTSIATGCPCFSYTFVLDYFRYNSTFHSSTIIISVIDESLTHFNNLLSTKKLTRTRSAAALQPIATLWLKQFNEQLIIWRLDIWDYIFASSCFQISSMEPDRSIISQLTSLIQNNSSSVVNDEEKEISKENIESSEKAAVLKVLFPESQELSADSVINFIKELRSCLNRLALCSFERISMKDQRSIVQSIEIFCVMGVSPFLEEGLYCIGNLYKKLS